MKRISITLAVAMLSILMVQAQSSSIFIGASGGINLSKFEHTQNLQELYSSGNSILGVNAGFEAGIQLQNFVISTGLQYIQKGAEYRTDNFNDGTEVGFFTARERLHYLAVPLLVGYRHEVFDGVALSVDLGPSFNFGLSGKLDETTEYFGSDDVDMDHYRVAFGNNINEDYRPMQVGFQFSPGVVIDLTSRSKLTFNATWDVGTADAFNPRYKNANDFFDEYKGDQFNRSTIFTVGYEHHFALGDKY